MLNEACKKIFLLLKEENLEKVKGPIPMPTKKRIYCVLRSPHVDKDSREQFEIRRYKRIIDIYSESTEILETIQTSLDWPPGVFLEVRIHSFAESET